MGTTQGGLGTTAAGLTGRIIMEADIVESQSLGGDKVRVKLKSGEVVVGQKLPDGRIIRGASVIVPDA